MKNFSNKKDKRIFFFDTVSKPEIYDGLYKRKKSGNPEDSRFYIIQIRKITDYFARSLAIAAACGCA